MQSVLKTPNISASKLPKAAHIRTISHVSMTLAASSIKSTLLDKKQYCSTDATETELMIR